MSMLNVFQIAGSALNAQSVRLNTTASNLANVESALGPDGQPYRAKQVVFQAVPMGDSGQGVRVKQIVESAAPGRLVYDPKSPVANAEGYVTLSNVDAVEEMVNMISASRAYQNNAEVMTTARTLMQKTLTIGQS
ncbi:MAG: flagellar basal body rod protein FlgC [Candidatus Dactylopiibacterium carminicum]|uniref:Flagellar basal-body rod protein FlgC n=1 Tax=Candidatus Dactylopiibacterium carminicum TaxID=857335 RepID=A0A272EU71_9RHOO|nr:flagellar basal body rod protein FlgC [Candidatus Dactylopiibacterium carminicum]KAF7599636.1 flagellar basal body rod protein FlgC [Candidatus Dactylopiibacterium carminicum]PAS93586.1 MAG: flagellar basal body rod protein FlgC [Candidatus Dactylopiibacterium carminicum]PAS97421.1 MAG: flagellar basal body rod protein FlgC [Candidatus Dactylopiibacterium carminicum]PAS99637.1 MAG: flagellar basal body rod protein FlgC [Candidatus Dactylopiibacterium carminicum]